MKFCILIFHLIVCFGCWTDCQEIPIHGNCPIGWMYFSGECLFFSIHDRRTWNSAQMYCSTHHNSHLATIDNAAKNQFIKDLFDIHGGLQTVHWVGGTDKYAEGHWTWLEGDPVGPYTNWGPGYPDNATDNHDCMVTNLQGGYLIWRDRPCSTIYNYICQFTRTNPLNTIG